VNRHGHRYGEYWLAVFVPDRERDLTGAARWQAIPSNFSRRLGRHLFGGV
jgi:hypothetical protein